MINKGNFKIMAKIWFWNINKINTVVSKKIAKSPQCLKYDTKIINKIWQIKMD